MKTEIEKITSLLRKSFEKNAWHGPSVLETLEGIDQDNAFMKTGNTHSIIELVNHMIAWRKYVIKRLTGDNDYMVNEEMNFPKSNDWTATRKSLEETQQQLMEAVQNFNIEKISDLVPHQGAKYTYYTMLHGIIHHDIYHTAQIALIKKANQ